MWRKVVFSPILRTFAKFTLILVALLDALTNWILDITGHVVVKANHKVSTDQLQWMDKGSSSMPK